MTPQEFKAWLEGFSEAIDEAPTPEQWAKIKAKAAKIVPAPAPSLPVTVDRTIGGPRWATDDTLRVGQFPEGVISRTTGELSYAERQEEMREAIAKSKLNQFQRAIAADQNGKHF